jgi:heptosyltransferase-3
MRILFITSNRIGDAVLSSGLVAHLLATYPQARLTIACGRLGLWAKLIGRRWDFVVDNRGSLMGYFLLSRRRARLIRRPGPKIAEIGAILGLDPPPLPTVWTAPEDEAKAEALLPGPGPYVALAPTANWPGKIWPAERFARAFEQIAANVLPGARAVIFAGPGPEEAERAAPLRARLPGAIDLGGRLTLFEAAACLKRVALFIGNDSGLMHLAAASGAPTIGLFGPTPASVYAPAGPRARAVVAPAAEMTAIGVEAVVAAARDLLGSMERAAE